MEKVVLAYERNGMNLSLEEMKEMEALKKELADLATTFSTSIAEDNTTHLATPEELAGCRIFHQRTGQGSGEREAGSLPWRIPTT